MTDDQQGGLTGVFVVLALMAIPTYQGVFYPTGRQWYEACYERQFEQTKQGVFVDPKTPDPAKAIKWAQCWPILTKGFNEARLDRTGTCPNIPSMDYAMRMVMEKGGLSTIDSFLPAEWAISDLYEKAYPGCRRH